MEIILALIVFLICLGSFFCGFYVGKSISAGKDISIKQIKKDLGIKPKAVIISPQTKQKSEEILRDLPEE